MLESCLFCDNASGSREHLFPKWVLERLGIQQVRMQRGQGRTKIINPELKAKTVCGTCNNGSMSRRPRRRENHFARLGVHASTTTMSLLFAQMELRR